MQTKTKRALSASTIASLLITSSVVSVNVKAATGTTSESPRLWGADRYETAAKVAQTGWTSSSDYAVIASGEGYADALCAAPLAKANNAPILLTQDGDLNANTLSELKRLNVKHVFIVGGQGVVSQKVEDKIKSQVADVERLAGQNRYETSVKVAQKLGTTSKVVLASGEGYADALSAAPVAAIEGMPILLTQSNTLSTATAEYIKANTGITKTYVIGGYASVNDSTMNSAPGAQRISGADRYATNVAVINNFASDFDFKKAYFALGNGPTGNEFADALTGSALAAKDKAPLIIVGKELSDSTKELIKTKLTKDTSITVLGGTANIADSLVSDAIALKGSTTTNNGGSSGGGSSSSTTYLNATNNLLGTISGPAYITTAGVKLSNGTVNGDLYVNADSTTLSAITVTGTLYVNPGTSGSTTLDSVTAANVVVQSGDTNSIHFKGKTKVTKLTISAVNNNGKNIRIVVEGTNEGTPTIASTEVGSQVILQATAGSFGTITIPQSIGNSIVTLRGSFDRPIIVEGNVNINVDLGASIPALVIPEGVSASAITLSGNGTIANIQVKSAGATLTIPDSVVTESIVAVPGNSVSTSKHVDLKSVSSMEDLTTYKDMTGNVGPLFTQKFASYVTNHPNLNNYFTITTGSAINVQINDSNLNSLSSAFDRAQAQSLDTIKSRLSKAQSLMDLYSPYVTIDGGSYKQFLTKLNSEYIKIDGSLDIDKIADRINNNTLNYAQFKQHLHDKIEAVYTTSNTAPKLSFSYSGIEVGAITTINKDGAAVYNSSTTIEANITNLLNIGDSTPGTYTVYCGTNFFTVKVLAK